MSLTSQFLKQRVVRAEGARFGIRSLQPELTTLDEEQRDLLNSHLLGQVLREKAYQRVPVGNLYEAIGKVRGHRQEVVVTAVQDRIHPSFHGLVQAWIERG